MSKVDSKEVKETFEGFCEINDISKDEEERFKDLVDDMKAN